MPKFKIDKENIYDVPEFAFGVVEDNEITYLDTCKELYLDELMAYGLDDLKLVAGVFAEQKNKTLNVLNSFEEEFSLPITKIVEIEPKYCVVPVSKKWKTNWVTVGLFLSLFRASLLSVRPNWRNVKRWDLPNIYGQSDAKIKALWSDTVAQLWSYYETGDYSCLFFLEDFSADEWARDNDITIDAENIPLINAAVKFQNL